MSKTPPEGREIISANLVNACREFLHTRNEDLWYQTPQGNQWFQLYDREAISDEMVRDWAFIGKIGTIAALTTPLPKPQCDCREYSDKFTEELSSGGTGRTQHSPYCSIHRRWLRKLPHELAAMPTKPEGLVWAEVGEGDTWEPVLEIHWEQLKLGVGRPLAYAIPVPREESQIPDLEAGEIDGRTPDPHFHNPDGLPTAGDPPWRFLVASDTEVYGDDEFWDRGNREWSRLLGTDRMTVGLPYPDFTYRTRRPLSTQGQGEEWIPHVWEEGSREHVISYDRLGEHCSKPRCEKNKHRRPASTQPERTSEEKCTGIIAPSTCNAAAEESNPPGSPQIQPTVWILHSFENELRYDLARVPQGDYEALRREVMLQIFGEPVTDHDEEIDKSTATLIEKGRLDFEGDPSLHLECAPAYSIPAATPPPVTGGEGPSDGEMLDWVLSKLAHIDLHTSAGFDDKHDRVSLILNGITFGTGRPWDSRTKAIPRLRAAVAAAMKGDKLI